MCGLIGYLKTIMSTSHNLKIIQLCSFTTYYPLKQKVFHAGECYISFYGTFPGFLRSPNYLERL